MSKNFDLLAATYIAASPELSSQFVQGIVQHFNVDRGSSVLELGCGFGNLALALAAVGAEVEALDSSHKMISACRIADRMHRVKWHLCRAEEFPFRQRSYDLVISYESFHLFDAPGKLVRNIADALDEGGVFCVGWCDYFWQEPLRDIILEEFAECGIEWPDWGYQRCEFLADVIAREVAALSPARTLPIRVRSQWSASRIALFLSSIGITAQLTGLQRRKLRSRLQSKIHESGLPRSGCSEYCIHYWCRTECERS